MVQKIDLSILVAAFNEEQIIAEFIKKITNQMADFPDKWEMIIVENGSTDNTAKIISDFSKINKNIKLFQLPKPAYGKAMITAFSKSSGQYAVFFNVDFWDKKFIDLCQVDLLGFDIISSSKLLPGSNDQRPFSRRVVTLLYSLFLKMLLGFKGTDTHGIKAFRVQTVMPLLKRCKTETGIFDSELILRCQRRGLKILELPVNVSEIRQSRFKLGRLFYTPVDLLKLFLALKK